MPSSATALLSRARAGDATAFDMLAREHSRMVYGVAFTIVGNHHDAEDVAQRALLSAWQGLANFRGDAAFSSWLHQITRRHALNCATRRPPRSWLDLADVYVDSAPEPADAVLQSEQASAVTAAVAALPDPQRRILCLHHFDGLSYAQIARRTGCTVPAVRSHLFRARRGLATTLADHG